MRSLSAALVCLALVARVSHALIDEGECPLWTNIDEFDLAQYTGRWYEDQRFEAAFEDDLGCVTADYVMTSDTTIDIIDAGMLLNGELVSTLGNASTTTVPGELSTGAPDGDHSLIYVLGTDYQSYSSVYACSEVGQYREQFAWVLSKDIELDPTILEATMAVFETSNVSSEAAMAVFEASNVDVSFFQKTTQQGNCTYIPEP